MPSKAAPIFVVLWLCGAVSWSCRCVQVEMHRNDFSRRNRLTKVQMRRLVLAVTMGGVCVGGWAQERPERPRRSDEPATQTRQAEEPEPNHDGDKEKSTPIPAEKTAVTEHVWTAGGHSVHYTATAGNLLIRDENEKPNGSIFYVAYTADGVPARERPVTFFYNGGPGSAGLWGMSRMK